MPQVGNNYHNNVQSAGVSGAAAGGESFTTAQKNINASILEYMLKYGFMKTVDIFQVSRLNICDDIDRKNQLDLKEICRETWFWMKTLESITCLM